MIVVDCRIFLYFLALIPNLLFLQFLEIKTDLSSQSEKSIFIKTLLIHLYKIYSILLEIPIYRFPIYRHNRTARVVALLSFFFLGKILFSGKKKKFEKERKPSLSVFFTPKLSFPKLTQPYLT